MELTSLYLDGKILILYERYMCWSELLVNYKEFSKAIYKIFSSGDDIVKEFSKMVRERSVEDYMKKFEELKSLMNVLTFHYSSLIMFPLLLMDWRRITNQC